LRLKNLFTKDLRQIELYKTFMDEMLAKYSQRCIYCIHEDKGWCTGQKEVFQADTEARKTGDEIINFSIWTVAPCKMSI